MDLGYGFFLVKFTEEHNFHHALHDGPWFVYGNFISIKKWDPKFFVSHAYVVHTGIWIQLPELPTKFYDFNILGKVGEKIGTLQKIDACTSSSS